MTFKTNIDNLIIEICQGDITKQPDIEAIVNSANANLTEGGGVSLAIHRAAGKNLKKEASKYAPLKVAQAIITKAYLLPNKYVIHCLGPRYKIDHPHDKLLSLCYINVLKLAEKNKISSIAFPSISTGIFGYPIEEAVKIVLDTIKNIKSDFKNLKKIRFVLFNEEDFKIYLKTFSQNL